MKKLLKIRKEKKILLSDKLYIPIDLFKGFPSTLKADIIKPFTKVIRDKNLCDLYKRGVPCALRREHGDTICLKCDHTKSVIELFKKTKKWFWVERGDVELIKKIIKKIEKYLISIGYGLKVVDRRTFFKLPMDMRLSVLWEKLKEPHKSQQKKAIKEWCKKGYGIIIAPPRFGKTVIGVILSAKSKTRVAIITHQKELLTQFESAFMKFSDIKEKRNISGKQLIRINPKPNEIKNLSVCLFTWQQFLNKKRLAELQDKFGLIIIDEIHFSSADKYSDRISRFKAKFRAGLTATHTRRDQKEIRGDRIIGPPLVKGGSEQLQCKYKVTDTGFFPKVYKTMNNRNWNNFWASLVKAEDRNELIAKYIIKDVKKGHKVVVPLKRIDHIFKLAEILKKKNKNLKVAVFHGSVVDRDNLADKIRKGKFDVVLATAKIISVGFNAPPLSCLHVVNPIFDRNGFYQQYSRIRTKCKNKPTPLIRLYVDEGNISKNFCKRSLVEFRKMKFIEVVSKKGNRHL